ncbi:MAG: sigma-54 interaction domain-containing protein, partial [Kiritimatiellia bacterium]
PFIRVYCAALPEGLIESELFGHVKGAFTGAMVDRKGRFELADGGTIFLDEIGEVPLAIQAKLLRVIQEREFERVGGTQTIKVDVRIVAATHRDLSAMVEKNLFREDLFYRLNVFPIYVPALVKRKADIILLAEHFVKKYAALSSKTITSLSNQAVDRLMSYRWPGNVRELENCMERAVLLTDGPILQSSALPATVQSAGSDPCELDPVDGPIPASGNLEEMVGSYEKAIITEALKATHYNAAAAARALHTTPRILSYKVKTYGIKRP